jgi:putative transposase
LTVSQQKLQKKPEIKALMRGKKVKGRKRHILVDTLGLVIEVLVHSAGIQDRDGGRLLVSKAKTNCAAFTKGFADGGYRGEFINWAKDTHNVAFEIVKRSDEHKFVVLPKRWIVERTLAWISRYRRLAKDFERITRTVRNWIFLAMTRLMLKRLAREYG